jgi:RNA polymerase sigma-70 factor (ECF subfamily)
MPDNNAFIDLLTRVRAGDEEAAAEVVRQYEKEIRREVRLRLKDLRLRRLFDSMDICQSVLASFFGCMVEGKYEMERPEELLKLLVGMTRNKLAFQVRKQRTQRRDHRWLANVDMNALVAAGTTPSQEVEGEELLQRIRERLTGEERRLADLRAEGWDWVQIAGQLGSTPDGRRMQYHRTVQRIAQELRRED